MESREKALGGRQSRRTTVPARSIPRDVPAVADGLLAVLPVTDRSPVDEAALNLTDVERASLSTNPFTRRSQLICFREARRATAVDPTAEEIAALEREMETDRRRARWDGFVPPRYRDACLDSVAERSNALAAALLGWAGDSRRPNLIVTGPIGVGKTFAALAAVRSDVEAGRSVRYWSVGRLMQELRPGAPATPEVLAGLLDADVLVLDDLGVEKMSEWTTEQLTIVVDDRYSNCRPIVVTTNDLGSLAGSTRDRGKSRLLDGALVLAVGGTRLR
jgi:DNA replication protein DnaC